MRRTGKILCLLLLPALLLSFAACGNANGTGNTEPAETDAATDGPTAGPTAEPTAEPTAVPWQVDELGRRIAGTDSGLTRDGTPKKYFTISFDDGITQDKRIIEIFNKYGFKGCTFFINTGLFGENWTWVGQTLNMPSLSHLRWTEEEIRTGIYDGFDVANHTMTHPSLKNLSEQKVIREVEQNAINIYNITGIYPVGMAWPGGDSEVSKDNYLTVSKQTTCCFARGTTSTGAFKLPKYWLKWEPSCSITQANVMNLAEKFLKAEATQDMLFYVWGHGYELDYDGIWDRLEDLVKMMTEAEDVVIVTNSEFYQLFKDEIPVWKE